MDTSQWAQGIVLLKKPIINEEEEEELLHNSSAIRAPILLSQQQLVQKDPNRKAPTIRPQKEQALLHCPRCNSTNTKFCYYNNYSLTQPRYFCKTCRRYWTQGGSLRNVPVGGGSRKNKRHSSSPSSSSPKIPPPPPQHDSTDQDLNLSFPNHGFDTTGNNIITSGGGGISAMELLRSRVGPMVSMMPGVPLLPPPDSGGVIMHGNDLYDFDHRRVLFPNFGELKQEQHRGQLQGGDPTTMFWNGMNMGGGGGSGSW